MNNRKYLASILPHEEPMILIDDIVDYSIEEKWLKACVTIREDDMFYDKRLKGIDSSVGIEYMAQSIGCYSYLKDKLQIPKIGYLLGTRLYNNAIKIFELGKTYYIKVFQTFIAQINSFECVILDDKDEELASATINVYQKDEDE